MRRFMSASAASGVDLDDRKSHAPTTASTPLYQVFVLLVLLNGAAYVGFHHFYNAFQRSVSGVSRTSVAIVVADVNENCWSACRSRNLRCDVDLFELINDCESMTKIFPQNREEGCGYASGFDMPAYDRSAKKVHVSTSPSAHPPGCGGRHPNTRRACVCRAAEDHDGDSESVSTSRPVHVVYSAEDSDYMEWQARYDYFWFERIGWKNAKLTRLLAASEPPKVISVPTHVAPPYNWTNDVYKAYNKPLSIMDWFKKARPSEDVVIVVDPDCMFLKPFEMQELVFEGKPIAMKALFSFDYKWRDRDIVNRYAMLGNFTCARPDPVAVPVLIHRNDLERLAPLWLKWTELIRNDTEDGEMKWDPEWKKVSFSWTAEMFGYVLAACELGLRHDIWPDLQAIPGQNATDLKTHPIIHYHTPVWAKGVKWVKYPPDAHTNFIWPLDKVWFGVNTPLVDRTFFTGMYDASRALYGLPDDDFVWQGSQSDKKITIARRNVAYRGCYRSARGDNDAVLVNSVSHGVHACAETCVNRNKSLALFARGTLCHCGENADRTGSGRVPVADAKSKCNAKCKDGAACGAVGSDAYMDVYMFVLPKPVEPSDLELVGCFPDNTGRRDLPLLKKLSVKSPGECMRACLDAEHDYAGVQMGQECWCGKTAPGRVGPAFEGASIVAECKFKCGTGDQCGGWSRNSVYKLRPEAAAREYELVDGMQNK